MPASFARELVKQVLYNPQRSASASSSRNYSVYTKEDIYGWLQAPTSNEQNLRSASNYLFFSSQHYQRLIFYYARLIVGAYVISPLGYDESYKKNVFKKQYYKVAKELELMDIPSQLWDVLTVSIREGVYYGVRWKDKNSSFIQRISPDICKITSICDDTFLYSVDMSKVSRSLEFYPPEFTDMYNEYLRTGQKYQEVPMDISVCVKADSSVPDVSIPLFAAVMPSLYTIANAEALQETADEIHNYKMIAGQLPVDEDGNPLMDYDIVMKYYNHLAGAVGENIGVAVTPFKLSPFTFDEPSATRAVDNISKAIGNFWSSAGTSGLLHGMSNDTAGVTKLAIKNDETYIMGMVKQYERLVNRYLKTCFSSNPKFKITILPVTVFNKDETIKQYKEAASFGLGKSYYAAAIGIPQYDVLALDYLEKEVCGYDNLTPLRSSYNSSTENTVGRPAANDEDLDTEGQQTRDNDTNANR